MNKLFKGMLATFLAVGFLAGCGTTSEEPTTSEQPVTSEPVSEEPVVVKHWVTFWLDTVGGFYAEEEVVHGESVTMPEDPTREGYTFHGWYLDKDFEFAFVPATPITKALDIYANFTKDYVPDTRVWHLIGDFANTDYDNNWDTSIESYVNTIMTKDEDSNLFSIEIEIGWMGKFKAKVHGKGWAPGEGPTEFDYTDFAEGTIPEYVVEGDTRNIQFTTAGLYKVEIETDLDVITVERLGDAVGEGVKPDPDPNAVLDWGMVGTINNWGDPDTENNNEVYPDIAPEYVADPGYHVWKNVYLEEGAAIKFRTDNSWGVELGYTEGVTLPEGITMEMEGEAGAETPKVGGNLLIETTGFYAFAIQKVEEVNVLSVAAVGFALRGTATVGGWDADSETLALVDTTLVEEVTTYTYEGTFDLLAGEFKVKTTGVGPYNGWDNAFGDAEGEDFTVAEAGSYTVTLVVTFDEENAMFVGDASFAPAVASTPDLFISEWIEPSQGNGNNKFIEIYNPLSEAVDLSTYTMKAFPNGAATASATLALTGTLAAGEVLVVYNEQQTIITEIPSTWISQSYPGLTDFNGDDTFGLFKNDVLIDLVGEIGVDPGTEWSGLDFLGASVQTKDSNWTRHGSITVPNATFTMAEWVVGPWDTHTLGTHTLVA